MIMVNDLDVDVPELLVSSNKKTNLGKHTHKRYNSTEYVSKAHLVKISEQKWEKLLSGYQIWIFLRSKTYAKSHHLWSGDA